MSASHSQPERGTSRAGREVEPAYADARQRRGWDRAADAAALQVVADIVTLSGSEAEQLARRQTRVLWEVTRWPAQNASGNQQSAA